MWMNVLADRTTAEGMPNALTLQGVIHVNVMTVILDLVLIAMVSVKE